MYMTKKITGGMWPFTSSNTTNEGEKVNTESQPSTVSAIGNWFKSFTNKKTEQQQSQPSQSQPPQPQPLQNKLGGKRKSRKTKKSKKSKTRRSKK